MALGDVPLTLIFGLENGLCPERLSSKRYLSDVKNIFYDTTEAEKRLAADDQLIYEFYELPMPQDDGDLAFGTSITYPGMITNPSPVRGFGIWSSKKMISRRS